MKLWSDNFADGAWLPPVYGFSTGNRNPHLAWDEVPNGSESLALFCIDFDAPQDASLVNREGVSVPLAAPRGAFFHWSLLDMPVALRSIADGRFSGGVTEGGKRAPQVWLPLGGGQCRLRQGLNDYSGWFAGDAGMQGDYFGYDGPCPPCNDERLHHYLFRLYALDVPRLVLPERFTGQQAHAALHGHILDEAQLVAAYTLNPALAQL